MKKRKIVILAVIIISIVFILYRGVMGSTKINGVSYNLLCTDEQLMDRLKSTSQRVYFKDDNLEKQFVEYEYDVTDILQHSTAKKFIDNLLGKRYSVKYDARLLKEEFTEYLKEYNDVRTDSVDAFIYKDNDAYYVEKEIQGDKVDETAILSDIDKGILIDLDHYIINPSVYEDDLKDAASEMSLYSGWSAAYSNGEIIKPDGYTVTLNEDYTVSINDNFIDDQIRNAVASYCTVGDGINLAHHHLV